MEYYYRDTSIISSKNVLVIYSYINSDSEITDKHSIYITGSGKSYYCDRSPFVLKDLKRNKVSELCVRKEWEF